MSAFNPVVLVDLSFDLYISAVGECDWTGMVSVTTLCICMNSRESAVEYARNAENRQIRGRQRLSHEGRGHLKKPPSIQKYESHVVIWCQLTITGSIGV